MNHAEKCPVCEGKGKLEDVTCHGCNGKGWVTLEDQGQWYVPTVWPHPYYPPKRHPHPDPNTPYWYYHPTWTCTSGSHTVDKEV